MDQYNLIPNAFAIYSEAYEKIGEIGTALVDPDIQDSPKLPLLQNQLITASSLFYITTKLINLNDDGDAIIGINADASLVNSMLLNLKDACNLNAPSSMPRPFTTLDFRTVVNGNYPVGGLGAILQSNGLTYLPLEMGAPGEVLTASPTGLVWSAVVGNGIPSGGTTGQVLHKVNNTSYNVAWATLTPSDIGVSSSAAELNILDGAALSTAELNTLVGINTGLSVQAQLNTKASIVLNNGQFLVGNGLNVATAVTPTGDVTFDNTGLFAITAGAIMDADVSMSAAINRSKLASGTAYRVIVNDNTGVISEAAAIAANRVIVSNTNGVPVHSTITTTTLGFLDATSSIQTQLDSKLTVTVTAAAQGDIVYYNGSGWVNFPRGTNGQVLTSTSGSIAWGSATANGLPSGGTTHQYLRKIDNTNYNTEWHTFVLADVSDVVTTFTELNLLSGLTVDAATLNFVDIGSSLTALLNAKQSSSLPQNAIWRGNASNIAEAYPAGTEGYMLTIVAGVPTWAEPTPPGNVSGVAPSVDNAIARWNGTAADSIQNSVVIIDDSGNVSAVTTLSSGQISVLNQATVRLYETGSTNYIGLRAASSVGSDYTITLPAAAPGANTFLKYDGADYVWSAGGGAGTIGGTIATGQVAFASGTDTIAGEAAFTYNSTDNILSVDRLHSSLASDPVATVTNGDLFYSTASGVIDFRGRINGVWTNITRPGTSTKSGTYTIAESERNYITLVDTSGGDITIDISVDLSAQWTQTFINTGTNDINFTASGGMTLNAVDTACSTQWGWVTLTRSGSNTYYAAGALGAGGGGGAGTVTSVAMTVPGFLSVAGSPITTSGTLAVTLATQSANLVFAGPTSGGAATPTFRALVSTDIPDLSSIYLTTISGIAAGGELSGTYPNPTLVNSAVIGKVLTGYTSGAGTVSATDTILQAIQKLNGNTTALVTGVSSVSGTTNRITVSPTTGATVVDIHTSYAGQTSITTLGTITTGTLGSGAKILVGSDATGDVYYNGGSGAITRLALGSANNLLGVNNAGTAPEYKVVSNGLTAASGTLKLGGALTADTSITGTFAIGLGVAASSTTKLLIQGLSTGTGALLTITDSTPTTRIALLNNGSVTWTGAPSSGFSWDLVHSGNAQGSGMRIRTSDGGSGQVNIWGTTSGNGRIAPATSGDLNIGHENSTDTGNMRVRPGRVLTLSTFNQSSSGSVDLSTATNYSTAGTFSTWTTGWTNNTGNGTVLTINAGFSNNAGSSNVYKMVNITGTYTMSGSSSGVTGYSLYIDPTLSGTTGLTAYGFVVANANLRNGIGTTTPTALLHLAAGTTTIAPLKLTSGTNLTTAADGAIEYDGVNYFVSVSTTRYTVPKTLTGSATLDFPSTGAQLSADLTITVTGAASGDKVILGVPNGSVSANTSFTAWVSAADTVTVRFNNYSSGTVDPASGTFKVSVIKD